MLPDVVLIDPSVLEGLPLYQKKATLSDAVCHAVESAWSAATCEESRKFSYSALDKIFAGYKAYLESDDTTFGAMMDAAFEAGEAINITKTTGGHALCYKLTTKYGLAHGHAALLCVNALWDFMEGMTDNMKFVEDYKAQFREFFEYLALPKPEIAEEDYDDLADSVNLDRLSNNPVALTHEDIVNIYHNL
jgi:alcohol dehydrogenase class IV